MFLPHVVVAWLYNTAYQIVRVRFCVFGPNWIVFVSEVRPDCVLRNTVLLMWVAVLTVQPPVYATHTNTHTLISSIWRNWKLRDILHRNAAAVQRHDVNVQFRC